MVQDGTWSIGELAEQAGVTVKSVRFYSDRGLLPEAARSSGGHRRYGPEALDRLRLIRSLRTLDLRVPDVGRILEQEDAFEEVVAAHLRELGSRRAALLWREAALQLLRDSTPRERAERLSLIGALSVPPSTDAPARFWRRWLPPRLPARVVSAVVEQAVPQPPADPTPAQVLAFARLHAFVSRDCRGTDRGQPEAHRADKGYRPAVLYEGLGEAFALAAQDLRARRPPHEGEALDCFVSAYAVSHAARDTPAFRRRLSGQLAADPRIDLYWELVAELSGPSEPTAGAAHDWLHAALDTQVNRIGQGQRDRGGSSTGRARGHGRERSS
ncbi:helix-turn-helix domain-containing protein [Streptomyces meridianus]|uniref:MerR family transcriptional regulator n=1 Tax=Streptomyces meridianus TaxID=2938945 RepID=A0ABT0X2C8_9ACTN|nr:MerR family transcriptional regulator [Streptomyces meridianus]MCM2576668.1 MerR family transcriptional regulator [Streptomyces meridianus]